jgi:Flp pilus assembly protein CpaB
MKTSELFLASALALAASTAVVVAAPNASDGRTDPAVSPIPADTVSVASENVVWGETEKARLEKQGFPQYDY